MLSTSAMHHIMDATSETRCGQGQALWSRAELALVSHVMKTATLAPLLSQRAGFHKLPTEDGLADRAWVCPVVQHALGHTVCVLSRPKDEDRGLVAGEDAHRGPLHVRDIQHP